jgi:MoxR-like ATPase
MNESQETTIVDDLSNTDDSQETSPEETGAVSSSEVLVAEFRETITRIRAELAKVIVGQDDVLEQLVITVLVGGHCLITGLPGTAKTLMVQSLANALGLGFKRIQFTPDLMPTDVTGTDIIDTDATTGERSWRFVPGPIFTNVLLADEINRTPPKTQSALLEAMQEASVSIRGTTHQLNPPFVVLATQNPIELEGTYPLPEAQLDRFIFNVILDYLDADEEVAVVERNTLGLGIPAINACTDAESLLRFQRLVRDVPISDAMNRYAVDIVRATRPDDKNASENIRQYVSYGASVRAAIFLSLAARARALLNGRYHVTKQDINLLALPVLRHRLQLNYLAESDQISVDTLVAELLDNIGRDL